jgi:methylglutaconyl-CoA hydratase
MGESVLYELRDQVAWLTLNRPDNHNALTAELTEELDEALEKANSDDGARLIVLAANGRHFCAGADLKRAGQGAVGIRGRHGPSRYTSIVTQILDGPKPVLCRVQGGAFAGGLGVMSACDIIVAAESSKFAFTEVRLGLAPWMLSVVLQRKGTLQASAPWLLNGERFDARQALAMNIVHRVAPDDGLDAALREEVQRFMHCSPQGLRETKRLLRTVPTLQLREALEFSAQESAKLFASEEGQEGMAAFKEKRKPRWAP